MDYNEWLSTLKIGDKVVSSGINGNYYITNIINITSGGRIDASDGNSYKKGIRKLSEYRNITLKPITEEILNNIKRAEMLKQIKDTNFSQIDEIRLESIIRILNNEI